MRELTTVKKFLQTNYLKSRQWMRTFLVTREGSKILRGALRYLKHSFWPFSHHFELTFPKVKQKSFNKHFQK
jgi:hypothetical protein